MRFGLLFVVCVLLCVSVLGHPTRYPDAKLKKLAPGELPPFRSYHVHFLFEKQRQSDDCTGYDDAMRLREKFIKDFNVPQFECQGTFDQGQMCAFPVSLGPFGPFIQPEFAFFFPYEQFHAVTQWVQQHHQQFSALIHPNSGYEREDHSIWALWAGSPRYLDLTLAEFSEQMLPYYNTSCRDEPATYPYPGPDPTPSPSAAHVRLVSLQTDTVTTASVTLNSVVAFPPVTHLDQTGYYHFAPTGQAVFCAVFSGAAGQSCVTRSLTQGYSYTLLAWNGQLWFYDDASGAPKNTAWIRVINALSASSTVALIRDGQEVIDVVKGGQASLYDQSAGNTQHSYQIIDPASGNVVLSLPYYTDNGSASTLIAVGGIPSRENSQATTLLLSDGY